MSFEGFWKRIEEAIAELNSIALRPRDIERDQKFIRSMIVQNLQQYILPSMKIFRVKPTNSVGAEKRVLSNVWEFFASFLVIDETRKIVYLLDIGRD